jgi:hypothetical protein
VRPEGLTQCKIPIEPATFRLVAQWLNQLRHQVPPSPSSNDTNIKKINLCSTVFSLLTSRTADRRTLTYTTHTHTEVLSQNTSCAAFAQNIQSKDIHTDDMIKRKVQDRPTPRLPLVLTSIHLAILFTLLLMYNHVIPFVIATSRKEVPGMVAMTAIETSHILPKAVFSYSLCCLHQLPQSSCS